MTVAAPVQALQPAKTAINRKHVQRSIIEIVGLDSAERACCSVQLLMGEIELHAQLNKQCHHLQTCLKHSIDADDG
jgi:hypothetical protein